MDLVTFRKLLALDPSDPLSRFALGKKLFESGEMEEAAEHLRFANAKAPDHLATYHILAQTLFQLKRFDEARPILEEGIRRVAEVGEGRGRDLGPAMKDMLNQIPSKSE